MRHPIDPKVDCVFNALLGAERNRALLIHFLNAILGDALQAPITDTEIVNPYNDKEFIDDKLSIVDVKARDPSGRQYQVEIQLLNHRDLPNRILYGWTDLYSAQLQSGEDYSALQPTYAIWLLGEALLPALGGYAHNYRMRDEQGHLFVEHGGIWLLELSKFDGQGVETEQQRWLKFFNEAERLNDDALPQWMQTEEMKQAMGTLKAFSEKERAYHAYQARQNYLRMQRSIQRDVEETQALMKQELAAKEQAIRDREQAIQDKEQAVQEKEQANQEKAQAVQAKEQAIQDKKQALKSQEQERIAKEHALQIQEQERTAKLEALAKIERLERLLDDDAGHLSDDSS